MTYEPAPTDYLIERFLDAMHVCNEAVGNQVRLGPEGPLMPDGTPALDVISLLGKRLRDHTLDDMQQLDRLLEARAQAAAAAIDNRN
jgi:hypothetical protein